MRAFCALKPLHCRNQIAKWRVHQQVTVVTHKNIAVNQSPSPLACLTNGFQKHLAIPIIRKNRLPLVPATHHMVGGTFIFDPHFPWQHPKKSRLR